MKEIEEGYFYDMIDDIRKYLEWSNSLYDLGINVGTYCDEMCSDFATALDLYFGTYDVMTGGAINFFIWDLNFGEKWKYGCYIDNGVDIDLHSTKKLWEYVSSKKGCNG